ncbi:glucose 1-dehydrogenase [Peribacillus simplex]|uniref:glucose 1-dehydrogenase n=1 Tax=Peribacillus simplex TaxID=1478 RepID=UPI003D2A4563
MTMNLFDLTDKIALITGGSRGLGKSIGMALASAGAKIILAGRSTNQLIETQQEFREIDLEVSILELDVMDLKQIESLEDIIQEQFGYIDILVNAAGTNVRGPILEVTPGEWDQVINTNLRGTFFVSQSVARMMLKRNKGKILNLASLTSLIGLPNMGPYCASKGGVGQITKSMAVEWAPYIQVNAIAPGYFNTDMTSAIFNDSEKVQNILSRIPYGRTGIPEDLLGTAVFLASDASTYITGQILYVDGGWSAS